VISGEFVAGLPESYPESRCTVMLCLLLTSGQPSRAASQVNFSKYTNDSSGLTGRVRQRR
jgi:hypothetical protein